MKKIVVLIGLFGIIFTGCGKKTVVEHNCNPGFENIQMETIITENIMVENIEVEEIQVEEIQVIPITIK